MSLIIRIDTTAELQDAFKSYNRDYYSQDGYQAILDIFDDYGEDVELDVIAICCDYNESDKQTVVSEYNLTDEFDCPDIEDIDDEKILSYLQYRTVASLLDNGNFFYHVF